VKRYTIYKGDHNMAALEESAFLITIFRPGATAEEQHEAV
jgi:hypothetical protein